MEAVRNPAILFAKSEDSPEAPPAAPPVVPPLALSSPEGSALRRTLGLVTLGWMFGSVWVTATSGAPLTLFSKALSASPFQYGVLSALPFIASLVSMPASLLIERTGQRKKIFLWGLYLQRALWVLIALAPLWLMGRYGAAASAPALAVFLMLVFVMHAS